MKHLWITQIAACCIGLALLSGCQTVSRMAAHRSKPPQVESVTIVEEADETVVTESAETDSAALAAEQSVGEPASEAMPRDVQLTNYFDAPAIATEEELPPEPQPEPKPIEESSQLQPVPEPKEIPLGSGEGMTLAAFEQLALQNNPAIAQASASASKAQGIRNQVGLYPNPNLGYSGQQLDDSGTAQHMGYISQDIVTANKLKLNRKVVDQEIQSQLWEVETQRYRVLTDIRQQFYAALAAQRRRDLAAEFQRVAHEGVRVAELRRKALEGSTPEVLQSEIQLNEVDLIYQRAVYSYDAAWKGLTAVAGMSGMAPQRLVGELRVSSEPRNWDTTYFQLIENSPEVRAAQARVNRSIANMDRQDVQAIPNLQTMFSGGYDYGTNHSMMNVQVGIPLPIFNQNEGNITAAQAEYCRATQEVRRIQLSIQQKLAQAARQYDSAAVTVHRYETQILPKAQQTLDLSSKAYAAGEFGFLQVLVARRTFFDSNLQYNQALLELADAKWLIDGMLLQDGLGNTPDTSMGDGLRGQTLSGQ